MADNPWHPWGLVKSYRDGRPVISEGQLWQLEGEHRDAVERAADGLFLHLDQPYRVVRLPDRAWLMLYPEPGRKKPGAAG